MRSPLKLFFISFLGLLSTKESSKEALKGVSSINTELLSHDDVSTALKKSTSDVLNEAIEMISKQHPNVYVDAILVHNFKKFLQVKINSKIKEWLESKFDVFQTIKMTNIGELSLVLWLS